MKKVTVVFNGWGEKWTLGTVADNGRSILFEYSEQALSRGLELSPRHLKLARSAYGDFPSHQLRLPGLLADALPDGWGLMLMDRLFAKHLGLAPQQVSPLDRLALLADRAMGALAFEPVLDAELPTPDLNLSSLAHEIQVVVSDQAGAALKALMAVGGSPQGARPKALVQYDPKTQAISTLPTAPGTPWLVKFPGAGEHKETCAIEACYAQLARDCGLDVPRTAWFEISAEQTAFGIERFDRQDGMRVPTHTLAGLLHADFRLPSVSYQTLLRATRAITRSEREVLKAFERCVFNVLFNNRDDHAKNFSFRMDPAFSWKLAPCYDLTFCEGPGGEHQMDVEGEGRKPGRPELLKLAKAAGVPSDSAEETMERIAVTAQSFKDRARDFQIRATTRSAIAKAIDRNLSRMHGGGQPLL